MANLRRTLEQIYRWLFLQMIHTKDLLLIYELLLVWRNIASLIRAGLPGSFWQGRFIAAKLPEQFEQRHCELQL